MILGSWDSSASSALTATSQACALHQFHGTTGLTCRETLEAWVHGAAPGLSAPARLPTMAAPQTARKRISGLRPVPIPSWHPQDLAALTPEASHCSVPWVQTQGPDLSVHLLRRLQSSSPGPSLPSLLPSRRPALCLSLPPQLTPSLPLMYT